MLIPAAAEKIEIPMIASGGFADARGLVAALALGADGINMGTRFMCTVESCIHQNVKEAIVAGDERGTELIFRSLHNTARVASNAVSREVVEILKGGGQFDDVKDLVAGSRGRKVFDDGDLDAGIWTVGTVMGLINDIPTCGELVSRIVSEAEEIITGRLAGMVGGQTQRCPPETRRERPAGNGGHSVRWRVSTHAAYARRRRRRSAGASEQATSSNCSEVSPSTRTSP